MLTVNAGVEEENKIIIRKYRKLLRHAKQVLKEGDSKLIRKAFNLALDAHQNMRRMSGEPYIYHPLDVAQICVEEIGLGTTSIISALLHDVVEDTEVELDTIEQKFGKKVSKIINGLTKISGVFESGSSQQAENFRKVLFHLSDDLRVILIKLADRLHNMRTLQSLPRNKQLKIASETIYLYAPLAHRLGLYAIKSEMEDLYLKFTDVDLYNEIIYKVSATKGSRDKFIRTFVRPVKRQLEQGNYKFEIKGRPKSIHSVSNKMKKQGVPFEEVYDLFAIRIIIDVPQEEEKAACWHVYSIVTDFYQPNPDRLRDWISIPKANGYESLHTTVMSHKGQWVEVQIRTKRMDEIAEKGYAAHWKYKENLGDTGLDEWIRKVREAMEQNDISAIEFVDDFRSNLFQDEVFAFTPKGDLKTLPYGATALDFAFDIHTEVGRTCIGAKVNQKLVPLSYVLKNGDQVEVLNSKKQKPSEDWLKFVKSSKAKSKIKDALKEEKREAINYGKEIVSRKLRHLKLNNTSETIDKLTAHFNQKTPSEFYYKVGKGTIQQNEIKNFNKNGVDKTDQIEIKDAKTFEKKVKELRNRDQDLLLIGEDVEFIDYKFAKCCNPISGDDVFGFVTVNDGIKIHRTSCPNAPELLSNHGYRVIKAKWTSQNQIAFIAGLKIKGTDRIGIINDITDIISEQLKVNMRSITVDTDNGIFEGYIKLYVKDTGHLDKLIKKLEILDGVVNVIRFF